MTIDVQLPEGLTKFMRVLKPEGRRHLFSAAGNAVSKLINDHLKRIAPAHHKTADRLGATPTNHLQKRTSFASDESSATVSIPIPGINRAYKDLSIVPKNAQALTIPIAAEAYGKRVATLRGIGWAIFRPKGKDILFGTKDDKTTPLYLLRKRVDQRRDPTLLPTMQQIGQTAGRAMMATIGRYAKGAA